MCFNFAGPRSNDMVMSSVLSQTRHWDRPSDHQERQVFGFDPNYPTNMMMPMQQSNGHNFYSFTSSNSSNIAAAAHVSGSEPSSLSSSAVVAAADMNRSSDQDDVVQPAFIDFLGVGAT